MGRNSREDSCGEEAFSSNQHQLPHPSKTLVNMLPASSNQCQLPPTSLRLVNLSANYLMASAWLYAPQDYLTYI